MVEVWLLESVPGLAAGGGTACWSEVGSVCELDLIFNFHKAYMVLDELLMAGYVQESSKKVIIDAVAAQEAMIGDNLEELPKQKK